MKAHLPNPRPFALALLTLALALTAAPLNAQDVTVMPPAMFELPNRPAPTCTPPSMPKIWKPEFPAKLRNTTEPGYVIVWQDIDENGKCLSYIPHGSNAVYEQSVRDAYFSQQNTPAQQDGKPVSSSSWVGVIFNPACASAKTPDATPRLLKVTPIFIASWQLKALPNESPMLRGTVAIAADGSATNLKLESSASYAQDVQPAIERSLTQWQFAPARKAGQPVAGTLTLGFVLSVAYAAPPTTPSTGDKITKPAKQTSNAGDKPPEPVKQTQPVYPAAMRRSNMVGEVVVNFIVDTDGNVESPQIVRSNNPGFEQAALDCVLLWKFKPCLKNGKPVNTRTQVPIVFHLGDNDDVRTAYTTPQPSKKQTAKMPEGLRYDIAPEARGVIYPVYPYEMFRNGKKGEATVAVFINSRGVVEQIAVAKETAPEFGYAALAACEYFEFNPALLGGKPTDAVITIRQKFDSDSPFVADEDRDMLRLEKKTPQKIIAASKLDAVPKRTVFRKPSFPLAAFAAGLTEGDAVVEFLIDTEGKVRLPRIVSGTHPSFGYRAVQTVANWRYEPPMSQGKPVVTRVRIPFHFSMKDTAPLSN